MNETLNFLNARRAWLVRDLSVHGSIDAESWDAAATEIDDDATRVVFLQFTIAGAVQEIAFSTLHDHRGNPLPDSIDTPVIIPIAKNSVPVAVIGLPGPASFRLAKTAAVPDDALVDLWIIEARS